MTSYPSLPLMLKPIESLCCNKTITSHHVYTSLCSMRKITGANKRETTDVRMLAFHDFPSPPMNDSVTVVLLRDVPQYSNYENLQRFSRYWRDYPEVSITPDMLGTRESASTISAEDLFFPIQDSALKKVANVWREKGIAEAIRLAAAMDPNSITKTIHWIATRLKWMLDVMDKRIYQKEALPTSGPGSVADIVTTRNWDTSLIRCLAWHPHCERIAVATRDDRIRIFSRNVTGTAILRHGAQKSICRITWRPNAGRELAAACHAGILIWTIELGAASNRLSHAILLKRRNHSPVTCVAWHPQGDLLVSCSPTDLNMIIWDVSREEGIPLNRVRGGGLCSVEWSLCGSLLMASTCRNVFRLWNTGVPTPWHAELWTVAGGRVAASCFGPNLTLLFTSTEDPSTIFVLPLQANVEMAVPLITFKRGDVASSSKESDAITAGGRITSMEWDASGKYIAVLFQDSPVIALIKTKIHSLSKIVEVKPACLIKGYCGEVPSCINFYRGLQSTQIICLTIAWSSGRVQHFPIIEDETHVDTTADIIHDSSYVTLAHINQTQSRVSPYHVR